MSTRDPSTNPRFVVRPTSHYEADGCGVEDTARVDYDCRARIGDGLTFAAAQYVAEMLNNVNRLCVEPERQIRDILGACADAADDYRTPEQKEVARTRSEASSAIASAYHAAFRGLFDRIEALCEERDETLSCKCEQGQSCVACRMGDAMDRAREALGL